MKTSKRIDITKNIAIKLGCSPKWSKHYENWTCTCEDMKHARDSQCSVLVDYSIHRKAYGL